MSTTVEIAVGWRGVDYSFARPDPVVMAGAGITFVCRYEALEPNAKVIQQPEIAALHAAGIGILLNFEQSSTDWLGGAQLGTTHGILAKKMAVARGYPVELPLVKSADSGIFPWLIGLAEAHMRAFAAAIDPYPLGIYGGTTLIDRCADVCVLGWQANAASWSPNWSANVHVKQGWQAADHQTDPDTCVTAFRAWLPRPDPPIETITTPEQGDHNVSAFTHSDNDNDGHPPRFTFWALMPDGTKRHIGEVELGILGTRDTAPAMTMAQIDQLPDWVAPAAVTVTDPASHGTWTT